MAKNPFTKEETAEVQAARDAAIREHSAKHKGAPSKLLNKARQQKMKEGATMPAQAPPTAANSGVATKNEALPANTQPVAADGSNAHVHKVEQTAPEKLKSPQNGDQTNQKVGLIDSRSCFAPRAVNVADYAVSMPSGALI